MKNSLCASVALCGICFAVSPCVHSKQISETPSAEFEQQNDAQTRKDRRLSTLNTSYPVQLYQQVHENSLSSTSIKVPVLGHNFNTRHQYSGYNLVSSILGYYVLLTTVLVQGGLDIISLHQLLHLSKARAAAFAEPQ
jgi:hypothetical protein